MKIVWLALSGVVSLTGMMVAGDRGTPAGLEGGRPNILLILADDLAWSDLGCHGHPWHETPHLDALARDGLGFSHGYAPAPICSASRASILTGKSPARFDMTKLENVNGHHIRRHDDSALAALVCALAPELAPVQATLETAMPVLKERAKNLHEIADMGGFLISTRPIDITEKAAKSLTPDTRARLAELRPRLEALKNWEQAAIEAEIRAFLNDHDLKLGDIAPALRAALTGTPISPGIFDVVALLDKAEVLGRLEDQI